MKNPIWKLMLVIPAICLAACNGSSSNNTAASAAAKNDQAAASASANSGKPNYNVVGHPSYPPFTSLDAKGQMTGLDRDILDAIAEREGFTITYMPFQVDNLLESLNRDSVDIVASGFNITPERLEKYDFSEPYLEGNWVGLLNRDKVKSATWQDLKDKPIAVFGGSLSETQLKATGITTKIVPVKNVYAAVQAVNQGTATAVYDVDSVLNTYVKENPAYYTAVDADSGKIPFGFVIKKGNSELKSKLDNGLNKIRADGTYQKILDKYYPKAQ